MDWTEQLEEEVGKYEDKWVAISESEQKVVGSGPDAYEARRDAESNGYPEARLLRVPRFDTIYAFVYYSPDDVPIFCGKKFHHR